MEKIKVLIIEDNLIVAEDIAARLRRHAIEVMAICSSGEEAILAAENLCPDLILMDIELSGAMDGISAAQVILQKQFVPIIYLSDYSDDKIIERAKKTQPANFLTKPFVEPDLIRSIDIAFNNARKVLAVTSRFKDHIFLRTNNQVYVKLAFDEILYLKADRAYSNIITTVQSYKLSTSMNHIFEQINNRDFVKVHRSFIVNVNRITSLDGNVIKIAEHEVQMSSEFRDNLLNMLKIVK